MQPALSVGCRVMTDFGFALFSSPLFSRISTLYNFFFFFNTKEDLQITSFSIKQAGAFGSPCAHTVTSLKREGKKVGTMKDKNIPQGSSKTANESHLLTDGKGYYAIKNAGS